MVIMGIDASTTSSGWSIFNNGKLVDYGVIKPKGSDWRGRLIAQGPEIRKIIKKYRPDKIYMEDVPLKKSGGSMTLVILGAVQGAILGIAASYGVEIDFLSPSQWRSEVGLFDGTRKGTERSELKKHSIELVNKLFGLELKWVTPSSKFNEDDIADAVLVAYSQLKPKTEKRDLRKTKSSLSS